MHLVRQQRALVSELLAHAPPQESLCDTNACLSLELFAPDTRTRGHQQEARLERRPALYLHVHRTELGSPVSMCSIGEEELVQMRRDCSGHSSLQRRQRERTPQAQSPASSGTGTQSLRRQRNSLCVDDADGSPFSTFPRKLADRALLGPPPIAEAEASARHQPLALPYASDRAHEWIATAFATVELAHIRQRQLQLLHDQLPEESTRPAAADLFLFPDTYPRCRLPPASKSQEVASASASPSAAPLSVERSSAAAPAAAATTETVLFIFMYASGFVYYSSITLL